MASIHYSRQIKTSKNLLHEDFGQFPPRPLICNEIDGHIQIITTRGAGGIYHEIVNLRRLLRGFYLGESPLSDTALEFFEKPELQSLRSINASSGRFVKEATIALILCWTFLLLTLKKFNPKKPPARYGYFTPIGKIEKNIVILPDQHQKSGRSIASTISHEHIHALQHKKPDGFADKIHNPAYFLEEKHARSPSLLYISQKNEVEARLHEVVLSYFRHHKNLPKTFNEFLGLLVSNDVFGEYARALLSVSGIDFPSGLSEYKTRESIYADEISAVISKAKDEDMSLRFITEVLPVMYGNLLRYYGDEGSSAKYLQEIRRPNLFDELYGRAPLPTAELS